MTSEFDFGHKAMINHSQFNYVFPFFNPVLLFLFYKSNTIELKYVNESQYKLF
jgi:hypothetical protein